MTTIKHIEESLRDRLIYIKAEGVSTKDTFLINYTYTLPWVALATLVSVYVLDIPNSSRTSLNCFRKCYGVSQIASMREHRVTDTTMTLGEKIVTNSEGELLVNPDMLAFILLTDIRVHNKIKNFMTTYVADKYGLNFDVARGYSDLFNS